MNFSLFFFSLPHSLVVEQFKYSLAVVKSEFFFTFSSLVPEARITFHERVAVTEEEARADLWSELVSNYCK